MPEGHTLHRLARHHQRRFAGHPVRISSPQGRFAASASLLDGQVLRRATAHGKHLFHDYGRDAKVHIHLGLYGTFSEHPHPVQPPVGEVRLRMIGTTHWADLRGPAACELLTDAEVRALRSRLGPDPLRRDADPDRAWARISISRAPLAGLLLDQSVVAGIGNVYRAEVLFRHAIPPLLPGRDLNRPQWTSIWSDLVTLMRYGVRTGRIDTVHAAHLPEAMGRPPRIDPHGGEVYVYRRAGQPCYICGTEIATRLLATRKLYWCPNCQAGAPG